MHTVDEFREQVEEIVNKSLNVEFLLDEIRFGLLRNIVEECFRIKGIKAPRKTKAKIILTALFARLVRGFDFKNFYEAIPESEQVDFLSHLLYNIYYINLTLEHLISSEKLTFYLFQTLAIRAKERTIKALFEALSYADKLKCMAFCLEHFDEGAFRILQVAGHDEAPEIRHLVSFIDRSLVDAEEFCEWVASEESFTPESVIEAIQAIDAQIEGKAKSCFEALARAQESGLAKTIEETVTFEEVKRLILHFGLYDHQVPKNFWFLHEFRALDDKLAAALEQKTGLEFLDRIVDHIYAINYAPSRYAEGLELITFALPTAGKELEQLFWLSSICQAMKSLSPKKRVPIFVFDQSTPALFKKNARFIKRQTKAVEIFHLGTAALLEIASRLRITDMLVCGKGGRFGYGGARNAIFFIAPLLKYYFTLKGSKPLLDYVRSISDETLRKDFTEVVLQEKRGPTVIHMGDDDVHIPKSTLFADSLFAVMHAKEFFSRVGWIIGRRTTWTQTNFNLEFVLEHAPNILLQHSWEQAPSCHGMAGLLTKPKVCLNLPFGQEEAYLQSMKLYNFDFRLPSMHLSGYRFPSVKIPTNRFSGLASLLEKHYQFLFEMMLVMDTVDPGNILNRCALPWNDQACIFSNLEDAMRYILNENTVSEMKRRFFANLLDLSKAYKDYSQESPEEGSFATQNVCVLNTLDIKKITKKYKTLFPKEMKELDALFTTLKLDAEALQKMAEGVPPTHRGNFMVHAIELLLKIVGEGHFQRALRCFTQL